MDFPAVMKLLRQIGFKGWINIEQDRSTLAAREAANTSMKYVNASLKPLYT